MLSGLSVGLPLSKTSEWASNAVLNGFAVSQIGKQIDDGKIDITQSINDGMLSASSATIGKFSEDSRQGLKTKL